MFVSEARIAANNRNAQKSTGPRTPEGKERSRANALKHGLCSSVVVSEDALSVQRRSEDFYNTLCPQNDFHCWLVSEVSIVTIRIDRCVRMERRVRDKVSINAELSWDDDRRLDAILLGEQLGGRPDVVVEQLRKTPHGCEWLMARWAMLAYVAGLNKGWNAEQTELAFDLLGTPREFRVPRPGVEIDFRGRVIEGGDDPAAVARRQIDELEARRDVVAALDEANRALAESDLNDDRDPELKRLRRYEGTLHSRLRWCMKQLQQQREFKAPRRGMMHSWLGQFEKTPEPVVEPAPVAPPLPVAPPVPEPPPEWNGPKSFHPPFDLTDDEVPPLGQALDIPAILEGRRQKKLKKSQAHREAQRRKVDKLLA